MTASISNLADIDPFAEDEEDGVASALGERIHIRVQQRNGRKSLTTVQGLPQELDLKRILKAFKKFFNCNGNIVEDPEMGEVIQLQGDHRKEIAQFLLDEGLAKKDAIKIHGF